MCLRCLAIWLTLLCMTCVKAGAASAVSPFGITIQLHKEVSENVLLSIPTLGVQLSVCSVITASRVACFTGQTISVGMASGQLSSAMLSGRNACAVQGQNLNVASGATCFITQTVPLGTYVNNQFLGSTIGWYPWENNTINSKTRLHDWPVSNKQLEQGKDSEGVLEFTVDF